MNDLLELLYSYAEDYMLRGLLDRGGEYSNVQYQADRKERALRECIGEENEERLEGLLRERRQMSFFEGKALFYAGFQMALELTR